MPKPYRGTGSLYFATNVMLERPELAAPIAALSNLWTFSEDMWGVILGAMLGLQSEAALVMYHALSGTSAQRATLTDLASQYLSEELRAEFAKLLKSLKGRSAERNAIIHGFWFYDEALPQCLVLAPRNTVSKTWVSIYHQAQTGQLATNPLLNKPADYSGWTVYSRDDFSQAIGRLNEFFKDQDTFLERILASKGLRPFGPPARPPQAEA